MYYLLQIWLGFPYEIISFIPDTSIFETTTMLDKNGFLNINVFNMTPPCCTPDFPIEPLITTTRETTRFSKCFQPLHSVVIFAIPLITSHAMSHGIDFSMSDDLWKYHSLYNSNHRFENLQRVHNAQSKWAG